MIVSIKVVGVGGAGGNAINGMVSTTANLQGVEFIAMVRLPAPCLYTLAAIRPFNRTGLPCPMQSNGGHMLGGSE